MMWRNALAAAILVVAGAALVLWLIQPSTSANSADIVSVILAVVMALALVASLAAKDANFVGAPRQSWFIVAAAALVIGIALSFFGGRLIATLPLVLALATLLVLRIRTSHQKNGRVAHSPE